MSTVEWIADQLSVSVGNVEVIASWLGADGPDLDKETAGSIHRSLEDFDEVAGGVGEQDLI